MTTPKETKPEPKSSTKKQRDSVLQRIWLAQANALATILEDTPAKDLNAAVLNTARQFLADQGISNDTWSQEEADEKHLKVLKDAMPDLPVFDQTARRYLVGHANTPPRRFNRP